MPRVLLTGASGFIALHTLDLLLKRGYSVRGTVRSQEKADKIANAYPEYKDQLDFAIVEDIAQSDAFDHAVVSDPPFDYILHTASPFHFQITDPKSELIEPAIRGTTGILHSTKKFAPTVQRIVITSSFAAIFDPPAGYNPGKTWSEEDWNPVTLEQGYSNPIDGYRASKKFAELAAWDFVKNEKPNFDIATINPPFVFGPVHTWIASVKSLNTSNERVLNIINGNMKNGLVPTGTWLWVDVRDVATAHVNAIEKPEAGGKRFFVTAGHFSNQQLADIVVKNFPQVADRLPAEREPSDGYPEGGVYKGDNTRSRQILGLKYLSLEQSITDLAKQLLEWGV